MKIEEMYVIEYGEPNSYVSTLLSHAYGPTVGGTVGTPFAAQRFTNKALVDKVVDLLQYQGKNKARKYARVVKLKVTYEVME